MMALIKKDFYLVDKQTCMLMTVAVVLSLLPRFETFGGIYLPVLAMTLPLTTLAYDERCHWDKFLAMTPCRPETVVLSKYLFTLILTAATLAVMVLIGVIRSTMIGESCDLTENLIERVTQLVLVIAVNAISLPAVFRFGAEKGRFAMMAACFGVLAVITGGARLAGADAMFGWLDRMPLAGLGIAAAAAVIVVNAVSFLLSVRFYRKRRSGAYDCGGHVRMKAQDSSPC